MHYNQGRPRTPYVWDDVRRDAYHRRRALMATGEGNPVRRDEIAARDNYTCQLCMKPVDMSLTYPKWKSPTLDHTIPLSAGGLHDPSNVTLAHLDCNLEKGDKILPIPAASA